MWSAVAVLPGAGPADWRVLREEDGIAEYHAATCVMELHGAETEAYLFGLSAEPPSVYAVLRETESRGEFPYEVALVTASPYAAQDCGDVDGQIVEKIPMPEGLIAWVRAFVDRHHKHEEFKKRRRDKKDISLVEDGIGDPRIIQVSNVYRSPSANRRGRLQ